MKALLLSDIIDEFIAKLNKELAEKHPKPVEEYDPDWLDKRLALLEWKEKPKIERIIEKQEAIKKPSKPH